MSELNPKRLLEGTAPRLIDEWQLAPKLWDAIRFEVDHRRELLVEEGVESLKTMQAKIDTGKMKAPSFLMVLTLSLRFSRVICPGLIPYFFTRVY